MNIINFKTELKEKLTADLEKGILFLGGKINSSASFFDDYLHQKGQFFQTKKDEEAGIISLAERNLSFNKIRKNLFSLIQKLDAQDIEGGKTEKKNSTPNNSSTGPIIIGKKAKIKGSIFNTGTMK